MSYVSAALNYLKDGYLWAVNKVAEHPHVATVTIIILAVVAVF